VAEKPLMSLADWKTWRDAGMDVGSHTRTHAKLTELSPEQACAQIVESKQELQQALGCPVNHFCYPYGWFAPQHRDMVQQAGYLSATTTQRGRVRVNADVFTLQRIMVARATTLVQFAAKILTAYEDRRA
jgi:peptidoglycan/xylan/chitin deacetylase (PgdA/CDA1 family)